MYLHRRGYYHAYYDNFESPGMYSGGWQVDDETGIVVIDALFRPAIIAERIVRNRFNS